MKRCIDCGKEFNPQAPGASSVRGPHCNRRYQGNSSGLSIPEEVKTVVKVFQKEKAPIFLVGGCVRDHLLKRPIKDYDLATQLTPAEIVKLFPKSLLVGAQFGVIKVPSGPEMVEIATFRKDGAYLDGRHPETVNFGTIEEDVQRRDFTINGLFWDLEKEQVVDLVGGQADLDQKIIRAIGDPLARFQEDALRMLRAIRFSGVLGFQIETKTLTAIDQLKLNISLVSKERIKEELARTFSSNFRESALNYFTQVGLDQAIFNKSISDLSGNLAAASPAYLWSELLTPQDLGAWPFSHEEADTIRRYHFSKTKFSQFTTLNLSEQNQLLTKYSSEFTEICTIQATLSPELISQVHIRQQELLQNPIPEYLIPRGQTLVDLGFTPGPHLGKTIKAVEQKVFSRELTTPEAVKEFLKNQLKT